MLINEISFMEHGFIEVSHAPTGCMLIKREVIEKMMKHHPDLKIYQPTVLMVKKYQKKTFIIYLILYMILKLNVILVKTLDFVKDGPI
jgi:hypothetical protein